MRDQPVQHPDQEIHPAQAGEPSARPQPDWEDPPARPDEHPGVDVADPADAPESGQPRL